MIDLLIKLKYVLIQQLIVTNYSVLKNYGNIQFFYIIKQKKIRLQKPCLNNDTIFAKIQQWNNVTNDIKKKRDISSKAWLYILTLHINFIFYFTVFLIFVAYQFMLLIHIEYIHFMICFYSAFRFFYLTDFCF